MPTIQIERNSRAVNSAGALSSAPPASRSVLPEADGDVEELPTSRGFAALLAAYRDSGGTVRGDQVACLLEDYGLGNFVGLARLIAKNEMFSFEWRTAMWIPMFQFNLHDLSVRPSAGMVLAALGAGFDGWARAAWFARPNSWLQGRKPVDLMESDLPRVLNAARADRFVATG